jgi:hypothetical protein
VDPCGICECRAVPQEPGDEDSTLSAISSDGCGIVAHPDADGRFWSWSLLLIAVVARQRRRSFP